jgi:hypothetical protein
MPGNWVELVVFASQTVGIGLGLAALPAGLLCLWEANRELRRATALLHEATRHRLAIREALALALAKYGAHDEAIDVLRDAGLTSVAKQGDTVR